MQKKDTTLDLMICVAAYKITVPVFLLIVLLLKTIGS